MKKFCVYKHTAPDGRIYIGITSQLPTKRWLNGHGYINNSYFYNAIKKYGWGNFQHEILMNGLTKQEAESKEIDLIYKFKSTNRKYGFNICKGGGVSTLGLHWKLSDESIRKRTGVNHWRYGKHLSEEQRQYLSLMNSGKLHPQFGKHRSEETKHKISEKQKGKIIPLEQRKKISDSLKGNVPVNKRKVMCVETKEIFCSLEEAKRNKNITCIFKALNNPTKTAGGFHWEYVV